MSAVAPTNATVTAGGVVIFEYDGVIRAQLGSEIAAAVITGTITETQIADNAISTPKLAAGSVITAKLAAAAVVAGTIAAEAVEAGKIKAGAVTAVKIAASAVTAEKIAVSELSAISANIGTVTAGVIQGPTIRTGTVGARVQLTSSGLLAFNAGGEEVLSFSTTTGNLFIKGEVKAGSAVPATTITGLLTSAQIAELEAAKITGTIVESQVGAEAISTPKLKAGSVVTTKLAAASVTAEKVAVAELSALSANLGAITAGTITGATFRTSATNPKVQMDAEGVRAINAEGAVTAHLEAQGLKIRVISQESPSEERRIRWVDSEGNTVATVYGARFGKVQEAWLEQRAQKEGTTAHAGIKAALGNNSVSVQGVLTNAPTAGVELDVFYEETHHRITAWDKEERSGFLQLATFGKSRAAFGSGTCTWTAKSFESGEAEIKHGLGVKPAAVLLTVTDEGTQGIGTVLRAGSIGATSFKVKARAIAEPAAGATAAFNWIAIG